jgi:hypothetical protein
VECDEVGVLEKTNQVGFCCFLQGLDSSGLEAEVLFETSCNLADKALEGESAKQQICRLLVSANFPECDSTRPVCEKKCLARTWTQKIVRGRA